ncbi:MAG: ABC transporter permease subunit [Gammaproteobacteria bacterium]
MAIGGIGVIITIALIAFYLFIVVLPIFMPAQMEQIASYPVPGDSNRESVYYAMEEQSEVAMRITMDGQASFFSTGNGDLIRQASVDTGADNDITAFSAGDPSGRLLAFAMDNGAVVLATHEYRISFPDDQRLIEPFLSPLFGGVPVQVDEYAVPITLVSAQSDEDETTIAAVTEDSRLLLVNLARQTGLFGDDESLQRSDHTIPLAAPVSHVRMDVDQRELYFSDENGWLYYYDITDKTSPVLRHRVRAVDDNVRVTSLEFLAGGISILVGSSDGVISQWFPVRDSNNDYTLEKIRSFTSLNAAVTGIVPEYYRKGLLALDKLGNLGVFHTTAHRTIKLQNLGIDEDAILAISPRADAFILEDGNGMVQFWDLENEHPEVSWQSIWGKVWYESRDQPEHIWQSSSASSDFEPKFSLAPLAFGTLKAAFYAMLFAIPLAILGAVYTAYFMAPALRNYVKPTIEIMEALPTVILGFLAGLWLAPLVEAYLPAVFLMIIVIPLAILLAAWLWRYLPESLRSVVPAGWEAVMLMPVIIIATALVFWISQPIELWLFDGNLPLWITRQWGITYEQRNSLVVGIAIGFAVIPTIFSISEDAVFGVPKHLTTGSLALGATPWQTVIKVVLLTASPGIFSAVMIGLGRAVGETMIVVMATGNTAIMDMNIFQGFRALSANIAVEMPESEVGSTHYRILFLAGLVLFMATFLFNTLAEIVRQRLRVKYSSL